MPLYEYQCDSCGHRFEIIQKFSDAPADACPRCGGGVRKLVSSPAFQFKGSGWYVTDYARKSEGGKTDGKPDAGGAESKPGAAGASDGGAKESGSKETGAKDAAAKDTGKKTATSDKPST